VPCIEHWAGSRYFETILDLDCNSQLQQGVSELPTSVQEILINAAIDEALVTAIWNSITYQQASQNLQNLRCIPFVQQVTKRLLEYAIGHISRSLLVTRSDSPFSGAIQITEIGVDERISCLRQLQQASTAVTY
jgi:hypothetical protein